jgi:hypothetical protein
VILGVEDVGGELVDAEVVWTESGAVGEGVEKSVGGAGEGVFGDEDVDDDEDDEDVDVDDDVPGEVVWLAGGTGATVAGTLLGGPF